MNIIELKNVSKSFKNEQVLKDINLTMESGKIYGIIGKNGAGKTVLFKIISGLVRPTSGSIVVEGKRIGIDVDFPESLGMIIETPGFLGEYNAFDNLHYLAKIKNIISDDEIRKAIEIVGLDAKSKKKVGKFSLGMRQRLGIAQAIMENPDLIILDEPMNGLDKNGIKDVKRILLELKNQGKTIIMASHYAEDTEICDMVYEMDGGELMVRNLEQTAM